MKRRPLLNVVGRETAPVFELLDPEGVLTTICTTTCVKSRKRLGLCHQGVGAAVCWHVFKLWEWHAGAGPGAGHETSGLRHAEWEGISSTLSLRCVLAMNVDDDAELPPQPDAQVAEAVDVLLLHWWMGEYEAKEMIEVAMNDVNETLNRNGSLCVGTLSPKIMSVSLSQKIVNGTLSPKIITVGSILSSR
jgi:hypothetical protein